MPSRRPWVRLRCVSLAELRSVQPLIRMPQQVAAQLSQTDALLDKYANMLAKSETVTRLIFDERWGGADAVSPDRYHTYY